MKQFWRYSGLLIISWILLGCGFHLRGNPESQLGLKYSTWWVENAGEMNEPLKRELYHRKGIRLVQAEDSAVIRLVRVQFDRMTQTINRYGNAEDSLYTLEVIAQVYYYGRAWGDPIELNMQRTLTYPPSSSLVLNSEEEKLKREMYESAARSIVDRLAFLPPIKPSGIQ
ncbi:MAG: LPS assembly lipoprotein LptE [Neisseriaceae bacterium]